MEVCHSFTNFAIGLVPTLPVKPKSLTDEELAVQIEILRRRQLRRDDVRRKLVEYATRKGGAR